ncbi:3-methyl-2-oxobutanoate hydroxymethyltransferase [Deinococcus sp. KNUC1210]|uniref:3-methyl-2-oxobutanoate hydroxymethyltransferase n=1 Tax=Deinococcus sp. KNUC1210 TaxID=2917691 RepID=UPI001EF00BB3|nr:3-methyl-2-oxobutanoate hydroxymethyltransferase [Deinococcus sp. KNUC1210]ULH15121.1 3-methyl-2-oxobutanoate hydroxymethyltransferase [Deinococcus sp. KNUC1210]
MKLTVPQIIAAAQSPDAAPLVMVTAYDYPGAQHAQNAGVDLILVGDSLGNVVLGYDSTAPVRLTDIAHHARAARRGAPETFLIADLPFGTYQTGVQDAMRSAVYLIQETGADAVKMEGSSPEVLEATRTLARNGVPVMGHVGLLPQTATAQGGMKVQGRDEASAKQVLDAALSVQEAGAFAVVLEAIPARLARVVSERLQIPTIGIGAGPYCKGQVLVTHDLLGVYEGQHKKIAKRYAEVGQISTQAIRDYAAEVRGRQFPAKENSFVIKDDVLDKLY